MHPHPSPLPLRGRGDTIFYQPASSSALSRLRERDRVRAGPPLPHSDALHPEYAEVGGLDGRVEGRRQAEAEHHPALGRIDDAVVPQPRARVIGMALLLILGADRRLERFFFLRAPVL